MKQWIFWMAIACMTSACDKFNLSDSGLDESAQAVAETLSAIDEAATAGREEPGGSPSRASCFAATLSACNTGLQTRTFDECTRGGTTWDGVINLQFSQNDCSKNAVNDTVTRTLPNDLTVTGRRGATLTIKTTETTTWDDTTISGGQQLKRTGAESFTFEVLGINRSAKTANSTELFNISRKTPEGEPLTITGTSRADRVVTGGKIRAYHNLAQYTVEWVPANLTWESTCTCPVSGTLTGTATGSRTDIVSVTFTACGEATVSTNGVESSVTLDSCSSTTR